MKKALILFIAFFILIPSIAAKEKVMVHLFVKEEDTIAEELINYLNELKGSDIKNFFTYEVYPTWTSSWQENTYYVNIATEVAKKYKERLNGSPYLVVDKNFHLNEFSNDKKPEIKNAIINAYLDENYEDFVTNIINEYDNKHKYDTYIIIGMLLVILITPIVFIKLSQKK